MHYRYCHIIFAAATFSLLNAQGPSIEVRSTRDWQLLTNYNPLNRRTIVRCAKINVLNHRPQPVILKRLSLAWVQARNSGEKPITKMLPTLHVSRKGKDKSPQSTLLCTGFWDAESGMAIFEFASEPLKIIHALEMTLTLQVDQAHLRALKYGKFVFDDRCALIALPNK